MPDLRAVRENSARLAVDYAGARWTIYYRPLAVDDATHQALRSMGEAGEMEPFYAQLARLIVDWDATEGGQPVPPSVEGFKRVGIGLCGTLMRAILGDVANPTWAPLPVPASTTPWSNGSSPPAAWAQPPTTSGSSSPPAGPASPPGPWPGSSTPPGPTGGSPGSTGFAERWPPPSTSSP